MIVLLAEISLLENLSYIATVIGAFGFFLAVIAFYAERKKQHEEHQLATYDNLAKEYRDFLKLCLQYPELQVYDYHPKTKLTLTDLQRVQQYTLFDILVSLFESAYFQYRSHTNAFKKAQWAGWEEYIRDWCKRTDFRIAWQEHLGSEFDSDFLNFMNAILQECAGEEEETALSG